MALLNWIKQAGGKPVSVRFAGVTHTGKTRGHNEDAYGIDAAKRCAVIADGMGGLARGEVASRMVVDSVLAAVARGETVETGLRLAHKRIQELGSAPAGERMGATAVAMMVNGAEALVTWMGDSRAYLWRDRKLKQLTKDHSFVQELIDAGAITEAEAEHHPSRNVVTRAVGIPDSANRDPAHLRLPLRPGDTILLSTDGLHGYLSSQKIVEELVNGSGETEQARRLINRTLADSDAGDNVTVVCAAIHE